MKRIKTIMSRLTGLTALILIGAILVACDHHQDPGHATDFVTPRTVSVAKQSRLLSVNPEATKQILFGDLHTHTTFSPDAFAMASPIMEGRGPRPPSAACDFARYCSALDFWSINDHAEGLTPQRWRETKDAVRECNAIAGDTPSPDLVTFLGWEWSQVSHYDRSKHYGHKNVIFLDTDDQQVPLRPIAAPREQLGKSPIGGVASYMLALMDFKNRGYYQSIQTYYDEIAETPLCEKGVDTRSLPSDCLEVADDPKELFSKLRQWGFEHIVIPHGNAWGLNTPPGTSFDKQLNLDQHSPEQQYLFELFSGHGNSEEYRDWRAIAFDVEGRGYCPEPSTQYEPCCWRAGKIIRARCDSAGLESDECERREFEARQNFIDAGVSGHLTVPGQQTKDWLNCGQCEDCYLPGMDHRPATTGQYALAISHFDDNGAPQRFRFGFIGSSDNHSAAAGSGYKEFGRFGMADTMGAHNERVAMLRSKDQGEALPYSISLAQAGKVGLDRKRNMDRQTSFWMTGGLVAVHSEGRQREAIWQGFKQKEVYATSGDRILLWFDLVQDGQIYPMGSELQWPEQNATAHPEFRVKAIGANVQLPGCPDYAGQALGEDRLNQLCLGECFNPGNERKIIERIEIVRIRPQSYPNEPVADLIEDPWRSFDCQPSGNGCEVSFTDELFSAEQRDVVYYARAIQAPSAAVNAAGLRCRYDDNGQCIDVDPCYGDSRTARSDDCLAETNERAWSSPIFISPAR